MTYAFVFTFFFFLFFGGGNILLKIMQNLCWKHEKFRAHAARSRKIFCLRAGIFGLIVRAVRV